MPETETKETFDLWDLDEESPDAAATKTADATPAAAVNQWATDVVEKAVAHDEQGHKTAAIFDIETGARPLDEIECFFDAGIYVPPEPLPPWKEGMVKYGNAKKEETRRQKRDEQFDAYQARLSKESEERAAHQAEWLAAEAARKAAWLDKTALSPITGRVLLIGMLLDGKPLFIDTPDEAKNLDTFWGIVDDLLDSKSPLIGHNSSAFDLPFLVRRSWALGVSVPHEIRQGRYWNPLFRDTMEAWNCGARDYVKLDVLARFFGVGQKTEGVNGSDFSKLWFGEMPAEQWGNPAEQRAKAIEYNGRDLELTAAVAKKMGMM